MVVRFFKRLRSKTSLIVVVLLIFTGVSRWGWVRLEHSRSQAEFEGLGVVNDMLLVADIKSGKELAKSCVICHNLEPGGPQLTGPHLIGIVGAPIARDPDYEYSFALRQRSDSKWTIENLDRWLKNPSGFAPSNRMYFKGMGDPQDRMDLIRYLMTIK